MYKQRAIKGNDQNVNTDEWGRLLALREERGLMFLPRQPKAE